MALEMIVKEDAYKFLKIPLDYIRRNKGIIEILIY